MTNQEIIERLRTWKVAVMVTAYTTSEAQEAAAWTLEAINGAISALKGPTREQVERMRGEWEAVPRFGVYDTACSKCGYSPGIRFFSSDFCPACGAPMTDEAVDMTMKRLEEMRNDQ